MHLLKRLYFYLCWPSLFLYFSLGSRARVLLYDETGSMLLTVGKWKAWFDDPSLTLPGGAMKRGETPAHAAAREVREELGIELDEAQLELLGNELLIDYGIYARTYLFRAYIPHEVVLQLDTREIEDARWYSAEEITAQPLKPDVKLALQLSKQP